MTYPSLAHAERPTRELGRRGLLEVVNAADKSLSFIGGSFFSFYLPTTFQSVFLNASEPVEPGTADFQRGLAKPVRATCSGCCRTGCSVRGRLRRRPQ